MCTVPHTSLLLTLKHRSPPSHQFGTVILRTATLGAPAENSAAKCKETWGEDDVVGDAREPNDCRMLLCRHQAGGTAAGPNQAASHRLDVSRGGLHPSLPHPRESGGDSEQAENQSMLRGGHRENGRASPGYPRLPGKYVDTANNYTGID